MMIIGVDYHPSFQTIAFLMEETGECGEQELKHSDGQGHSVVPRRASTPYRYHANSAKFCKAKTDLFRVVPPDTLTSFELKFHALPEKDNVPVRSNERCSAIRFEKK
jgi:hypothetical protein